MPDGLTGDNVLGFAYLISLGAVLSYIVWFRGIGLLPATAVSFLALGSPVVATLLGYLFKDQTLSLLQLLGIVVIFLAVVLGQSRPPRKEPGAAPPEPLASGTGARALEEERSG